MPRIYLNEGTHEWTPDQGKAQEWANHGDYVCAYQKVGEVTPEAGPNSGMGHEEVYEHSIGRRDPLTSGHLEDLL